MPLRRWICSVGMAAVAATVLLLAAASVVFCEATLRVPKPPIAEDPGTVWRTVTIRARDGVALEGWFVSPSGKPSGACVAVLHGIADSRLGAAGFAPMFLAERYSVLLPDSRAQGHSGGEFVTYGLLEKHDVLEWAHWLQRQGCERIYGLGESLGASILIQAVGVEPTFRAIVAECPYADLRTLAEYRVRGMSPLPQWISADLSHLIVGGGMIYARARYGLDFAQVSPTSAIAQANAPILLIHGMQDQKTPFWHSQRLARANPRAVLWLVPNADHTAAASADPTGFRARVLGWFAQH